MLKVTQSIVLNDLHIPFNCPIATGLTNQIIEDTNPKRVILNGDVLDLYNCNSHNPLHPDITYSLDDEIESGKEYLYKLREIYKGEIIYIFGNHEFRWNRNIIKKAPEMYNRLFLNHELHLEKLDIQFIPYNDPYRIEDSNLFVQHSPPSYSSCKATFNHKLDSSFIWGCSHRLEKIIKTGSAGYYHRYFNGWLGSSTLTDEHKEVFSYRKGFENWQQGFSIVTMVNGYKYFIEQVVIDDKECVANGNLYRNV